MTKQQALDRLNLIRVWYEDYGTPNADYDAICYAIGVIEAQPEGLDTLIKALEKEHKKLLEMQKAQPEIIHCKDCIHNKEPDFGFCEWANHHVSANSCCADVFHAERRTNE